MAELRGRTVSSTYKDLFHIENSNEGLDGSLRTVVSGNGEETTISVSTTQSSIDFGGGLADEPQIKNARWTWQDHADISGTNYTISFLGGNFHKITLIGNLTNLVISNAPVSLTENLAGELTILIDGGNTYEITNWPTTTLWTEGVKPDFSTQSDNGLLLIKMLTFDGGTTWYGQIVSTNLRSTP